jgi:hypothetical protein
MINLPNLFLIAGTGRKTGKTTLACAIIRKFSPQFDLIGLKISPHFHKNDHNESRICDHKEYRIFRETSLTSEKDSSLMLLSGASQVFYMETTDPHLGNAFHEFLGLIPPASPVVCESPALRNYVNPGVFIMLIKHDISNPKQNIRPLIPLADQVIDLSTGKADSFLTTLHYEDSVWVIKP